LLQDAAGRVLVSQRAADAHLGGLWEFPGGKCHGNETARAALDRELHEELGIRVLAATGILEIPYAYPDRSVRLQVFRIQHWQGSTRAREGQPLQWVTPATLATLALPAASQSIVTAARLPSCYLITPSPRNAAEIDACVRRVAQRLRRGDLRLLQIRAPELEQAPFLDFAHRILDTAAGYGVEVLVNASQTWLDALPPVGWHLNERRLRALAVRPACRGWLAASVHDRGGLEHAMRVGVDFVVAGPVKPTQTHPGARPLGLQGFAALRAQASCPVYALGGLNPADQAAVQAVGAQGIAAIRGLLD